GLRMSNNSSSFMERAEIGISEKDQSLQAVPLAVIAVDEAGQGEWQPPAEPLPGPVRELKFVLRAYGTKGHFDETEARPLWMIREPLPEAAATSDEQKAAEKSVGADGPSPELLAAYGESDLMRHPISLDGGTV